MAISQWADALRSCYAVGMKLLSFDLDAKVASIVAAMNSNI